MADHAKKAEGSRKAGGILTTLKAFARDPRGAAAVEFAFIVPVLITLYLGSMEVSQALDVNKRVNRTASMVADLVTQQESVDKAQLLSIMKIGDATLQPYDRDSPDITIVAIQVDSSDSPKAQVAWSLEHHGNTVSTPFSAGSVISLPANLKTAGAFVVKVTTALNYIPITAWAIKNTSSNGSIVTIPMSETYYLRPRLTSTITCTDCG
jgi:Flp pilus assembly protein TadG